MVVELTSMEEDILKSPLFLVAGICEIEDPDWIDHLDDYIAETSLS